jgi:hypothetical protein
VHSYEIVANRPASRGITHKEILDLLLNKIGVSKATIRLILNAVFKSPGVEVL